MPAPTMTESPIYYALRLGPAAHARGERVICRWLGWAGSGDRLAHVRVTHSTVPAYRHGQQGLLPRPQLIALRRAKADRRPQP